MEFSGENAFACLPLYKFSKADFLFWINECGEYIAKGAVNIYAENVLNEISGDLLLFPLYFDDKLCMEIDTGGELEMAERYLHSCDGDAGYMCLKNVCLLPFILCLKII